MEKGFIMSIINIFFSSRNFSIVIINDSLGYDQARHQGFSLKKWVGRDFFRPTHF